MTAYHANQRLLQDLRLVMDDAQDLARATSGAASAKVLEVRDRVASALKSTKAACWRLRDGTTNAAKATDGMVRGHPYESLGIALGAGLLMGALIARR
jgi:ElaB/YqjD/DUF883 family membrane-anchored ribosome-binding protein